MEVGKKALLEDKAEVITFNVMSLAFQDLDKELQEKLGVPVVDPAKAAVKMAEMLIALNLPTASQIMETIYYKELR